MIACFDVDGFTAKYKRSYQYEGTISPPAIKPCKASQVCALHTYRYHKEEIIKRKSFTAIAIQIDLCRDESFSS